MLSASASWSVLKLLIFRTYLAGILLFIFSFPFGYNFLPDIGQYTQHFFEPLARWSGDLIFKIKRSYITELISDSTGLYINAFNILLLSILIAFIWTISFKKIRSHHKLLYWFVVFVRYYLALQLFTYGFSKIFKVQFYLPEPNILYTKLGNIPKDLSYWSVIGISRPYSIFLGAAEVIAAFLLLFRRTMAAGALFACFILINVMAINFAYDISVKLLTCFLLLLSVFLLGTQWEKIIYLFAGKQKIYPTLSKPAWGKRKWIYQLSKLVVICLLLIESMWPYLRSRNLNDDTAKRPHLHGAYEVKTFILNADTIPPLLTDTHRWKRIFIHRQDYFIIENMKEEMMDYPMQDNELKKEIRLTVNKTDTITIIYQENKEQDQVA